MKAGKKLGLGTPAPVLVNGSMLAFILFIAKLARKIYHSDKNKSDT
jgi:hypothetical protein